MQSNCNFVRRFCQHAIPTFNRHWTRQPAATTKLHIDRAKALLHQGTEEWPFQVSVNVQNFAPNELSVRATQKSIIVEGHHEEKRDDECHVVLHFVRRYTLPDEFENGDILANLSKAGILVVTVPVPSKAKESDKAQVRMVEIIESEAALKALNDKRKGRTSEK
jgi:HSP20 family molecular chaperone IbpA